jgi:hypothetical protein
MNNLVGTYIINYHRRHHHDNLALSVVFSHKTHSFSCPPPCSEYNRIQAKKCRIRKKSVTCILEESLEKLQYENTLLKEFLYKKIGRKQTTKYLEGMKAFHDDNESLIHALRQRRNLILDDKTIIFLQNLSR